MTMYLFIYLFIGQRIHLNGHFEVDGSAVCCTPGFDCVALLIILYEKVKGGKRNSFLSHNKKCKARKSSLSKRLIIQ